MAISLTLNFDDTWAGRLAPMIVSKVDEAQYNPVIVALLDGLTGIDTVDDLTTKQKAKLWILFRLLGELSVYEGNEAAGVARQTVVEDVRDNFPLEVGEA